MRSFAVQFSFFLTLSFLLLISACEQKKNPPQNKTNEEELVTIYSELCVIVPDESYLKLFSYLKPSIKTHFLVNKSKKANPLSIPEPTEAISKSLFLNGFYADYLTWKNNYKSPDPSIDVHISTWFEQLKGEDIPFDISLNYQVIYDQNGMITEIINKQQIIHSSFYLFLDPTEKISAKKTANPEIDEVIGFFPASNMEHIQPVLLQDIQQHFNMNYAEINFFNDEQKLKDVAFSSSLLELERCIQLLEFSLKSKVQPQAISLSAFQNYLINNNAWVFPTNGINPHHIGFNSIQKLIASGWFIPFERKENGVYNLNNSLSGIDAHRMLLATGPNYRGRLSGVQKVSRGRFISEVWKAQGYPLDDSFKPFRNIRLRKDLELAITHYANLLRSKHPWFEESTFQKNTAIELADAAMFIDLVFDPMNRSTITP